MNIYIYICKNPQFIHNNSIRKFYSYFLLLDFDHNNHHDIIPRRKCYFDCIEIYFFS